MTSKLFNNYPTNLEAMTIHSAPRLICSLKFFSQAASAIVILVGCLVLVGWMYNITILKSVLPGLVAMRPNTALGFILAGVSLWLQSSTKKRVRIVYWRRRQMIALGCSILVFLLGGLTLVEYFSRWDLHIDQMLFIQTAAPDSFGTIAPGRMAFSTALSFVLSGLSLILLKAKERKIQRLAQGFTLMPALLGLVTLIGYIYGVTAFTGIIFKLATMALHTAVAFIILSFGILCTSPDRTLIKAILANTVGGLMARRLLPAAISIPLVLGWLCLKGQKARLYNSEFGVSLFVVSNIVIFVVLICWNARLLNQADIERKRFEQTLQEKNVELENASLAKDRFLASMSHELRTPLNAVIGFTGTLLMKLPGPLTADQQQQLQIIQTSAKHLLSLINDLLDLAKIESGKVEINFEPVVCQSVVQEVATALRSLAQTKGLKFEVKLPKEDLVVLTDRRALTQVLINLTNNAIKFTETGRVRLELSQRQVDGRTLTEIAVADSGIGIQPEDQTKLFQAFEQVSSSTTRRHEGTGLGLHLSQKLAKLLGGQIACDSKYGKGSIFTLVLTEK
jgi:signal transduction histidine kinase